MGRREKKGGNVRKGGKGRKEKKRRKESRGERRKTCFGYHFHINEQFEEGENQGKQKQRQMIYFFLFQNIDFPNQKLNKY